MKKYNIRLNKLENKAGITTEPAGILKAPPQPESVETWVKEVQENNRKMKQLQEKYTSQYHATKKLTSCASLKTD